MDIVVLSKRDNLLLDRVEVRFRIVHSNEKTPDRESVREKLSAILNEKKDMVIIDSMKAQFGKPESMGYAKVYKTKEKAMRVERDRTLVRNKLKERKVKAKEKAAAPKAEAPKAEAAKEKASAPKAEAPKEKAPAPKAEAAKPEERPAAAPKQAAPEKK